MLSDLSFPEFKSLVEVLFSSLERVPTKTDLLDAGCGEGTVSAYLASRGFNVLAIDSTFLPTTPHAGVTIGNTPLPLAYGEEYNISPKYFSKTSSDFTPGHLRIRELDFFELEENETFDVITLFSFLHYMEGAEMVERSLRKAITHLRNRGLLALTFISDDIPLDRGMSVTLPNKSHVKKLLINSGATLLFWQEKIIEHSHGNSFDDPEMGAVLHQHNLVYSLWRIT